MFVDLKMRRIVQTPNVVVKLNFLIKSVVRNLFSLDFIKKFFLIKMNSHLSIPDLVYIYA